ncbi:molecular chaperone [Coemansia sp. RSA 637]|nr:molecular chaperone [Coemansia sp. RSA 637]
MQLNLAATFAVARRTAVWRQFGTAAAVTTVPHVARGVPRRLSSGTALRILHRSTSLTTVTPLRTYSQTTRVPGGSATRTCWKCQCETSQTSVLCENNSCSAIQAVSSTATYFDILLGVPPTFTIDTAQLRRNFLRLQQAVHPDSVSQLSAVERQLAESQSSWINHAYSTLKDPLQRAHYMLELRNAAVREDDNVVDPELLSEIMETREAIEAAGSEAEIAALREINDEEIKETVRMLEQAFGEEEMEEAQHLTRRLQYLKRVDQTIQEWELGPPIEEYH